MEGVQYSEGILSVLWGITVVHVVSTGRIPSVLWRLFITVGITSIQWGIASVPWRVFSTLDNISTCGDNISTVGDNISTVEVFSTVGEF